MRIVLVRPSSSIGGLGPSASQHHPVGLALLCAVLEQHGHTASIVDHEVAPGDLRLILDRKPDVVGLTAMTPTVRQAVRIGRGLKAERPDLPVILGGVHATLLPESCLAEASGAVDLLVLGEGERRLPELLGRLRQGAGHHDLDGVAWREHGEIRVNRPTGFIEPLDSLPFPDRSKIQMDLYRQASSPGFSRSFLRITEIFTSRGCPNHCIFCAAPVLSGRQVRFRSVENVAEEMRDCVRRFSIQHFTINDDTFTADPGRTEQLCRRIAPLNITWSCETRVNTVRPGLLRAMRRAGCRKVSFGVESGSPAILEKIRKGVTVSEVETAFALARRAGLARMGFFQVGVHPDETLEDVRQTWRLIRRIDPDFIVVTIATPLPGTPLQRLMKRRGLILREDWENYRHFTPSPSWRTVHFSPGQLASLQRKTLRRFYLRPRILLRRLAALRSVEQASYYASVGLSLLRLFRSQPSRGAS